MEGPTLEGPPWKRLDWQESCPESKRKMFNNLAGLSDKLDLRDRAKSLKSLVLVQKCFGIWMSRFYLD